MHFCCATIKKGSNMSLPNEYLKGKGAQINPDNRFSSTRLSTEDIDGLDEELIVGKPPVQVFSESPKKILSEFDSPDLGGKGFSLNPYQGCEHGCVYCYARVSHQYWGFSAGLDFETKIVVKQNAPIMLRKEFMKKSWQPHTLMLSGNTDCYQPLERTFKLTRGILEVALEFRNPVGIITKNALVTRDLDILAEMAKQNLVHVFFSITTLDESLRRILEPRTASATKKFEAMKTLSDAGVPTGIMTAPIIPGLNHHEIPELLKRASESGALGAGYTVVRLNGEIATIFEDWLEKNFPDRKEKILNQVKTMHGGHLNDSKFGRRLRGEGEYASIIRQLFQVNKKKYFDGKSLPELDHARFRRGGLPTLFD
jgi:DNA repair photolyase